MERLSIGSWIIEVDVEKTKEFYNEFHFITDDCECDYCANYVLASELFPKSVKDLFHILGIDPRMEGEVSEYMKNDDRTHLYGAFYHIVGTVIEGPKQEDNEVSSPYFLEQDGVEISFTKNLSLVPDDFPTPIIQFEIQMNIPWLLGNR